jgi:hypothetical protein
MLAACAADVSKGAYAEGVRLDANQSELYAAAALTWPVGVPIPVCWLNPTAADAVARGWVRDAVEKQWQANSSARFSGWGQCAPSTTQGIRIRIEDTATAPASYIGTQANGPCAPETCLRHQDRPTA